MADDLESRSLPNRMFKHGHEPSGKKKRVNTYFNLRWITAIAPALENEHLELLQKSQFSQVMQMGDHTFSVMFVHHLLSRQLVTRKKYELWWLFAGKPIRYAIGDFALATGLSCEKPKEKDTETLTDDNDIWETLFGDTVKPTAEWIYNKLREGKTYKDPETRFKLALLLLVDGILCPTSGGNKISMKHTKMLRDIDYFLNYPWGRESFLLTVTSSKSKKAIDLARQTIALQGFAHAMILVTVSCCPTIIAEVRSVDQIIGDRVTVQDIVRHVAGRSLTVSVTVAKTFDSYHQVAVKSLLNTEFDSEISFLEEYGDSKVDYMVKCIHDGYNFERSSWSGGVRAVDLEACMRCQPTLVDGETMGCAAHPDLSVLLKQTVTDLEKSSVEMSEWYRRSLNDHFVKALCALRDEMVGKVNIITNTCQDFSNQTTPSSSWSGADLEAYMRMRNQRMSSEDDEEKSCGLQPGAH